MKRFAMIAAASMIAGTSYAADTVAEIEVEADLTAIENVEAAQVWTGISEDLKTEIAERLATRISEDGASITVDIDEVSLASIFSQAIGTGESKLVGDVEIDAPGLFNKMDYQLTVTAEQAVAYYPAGTTPGEVTVDSKVYYDAMLDAFAENIASKFE